ncbi:MAG TPA: NAD(P)-dependent alcohol dehydrogenase [Candidatus Limnocylindrales bacterium]|nr:NAD(P)-dependent alcohol dehydrogenase [Candidatus Limnocylindrales bacterium]
MTTSDPASMRAITYPAYGGPGMLRLGDVPRPVIPAEGVLVRVHAASLNALDWHLMRGRPFVARLTEGLLRPRRPIPGADMAGIVEAVEPGVTSLRPGDEVFAAKGQALAQYVAGPASIFLPKPPTLTFEEAAALPVAGATALQALVKGGASAGSRVLVTGAGGGVGTFAVQIAKALGAHVTATTSPSKLALLASLGADAVLDYTRDDVVAAGPFDIVIDVAARQPFAALSRAMTPTGTLVVVGPDEGDWIGAIRRPIGAVIRSRRGAQRFLPFLSSAPRTDLETLAAMAADGRVRPVIDRVLPLERTAEGMALVGSGQAAGKVVIRVT